MTREEAIAYFEGQKERLEDFRNIYPSPDTVGYQATTKEIGFYDLAISALKGFEGMTNGEVMKAVFESDNVQFDETGSWIHIIINGMDYSFCPVEFWNAPYQKGGE